MNSTDYENRILDAIETITNNAIAKAGYDKTIQATIVELVDGLTGKYTVKYQDSEFEVYSTNTEIFYPSGTLVNISVPNGDFNLDKMIVSAVNKNQIEYTDVIEEEDRYKNTSGNIITSSQQFELCSYKHKDICVLYDRDTNQNNIDIDLEYIQNNILQKDSILCGAEFKTNLDVLQQKNGNYGLVFDLDFKNNSTEEVVTKSFILDINQMTGNPYSFSSFVRQYKIFKIDIDNFISIKKIYLFAENFPFEENDKDNDIFAQNFELSLLNELEDEIDNVYELEISTGYKKYFDQYDNLETSKMDLKANLLYKNQTIINDDVNFYWFKENSAINNESEEYCIEGGPGWECLNVYNTTDSYRQYVSNDELIVFKNMVLSKELNIKCVAEKNGKIIAMQSFVINNYGAQYNLSITSEDSNIFYFDHGNPTLKCLINDQELLTDVNDTYSYYWGYIDSDNIYHQLHETIEENEIYNTAKAEYDELLSRIETGLVLAAASQEELDRLSAIVNKHNQRVEANVIYDIDLTKITDQAIFKCAVIKNDSILLGTANYTIYNKKELDGEYYIDILNGVQTFHYTVNGIAPTNSSLENPIVLKPLQVVLYDSNGKIIADKDLNSSTIQWITPKENTMLIAKDSNQPTLTYDIAENYDENKLYNNNIEVDVFYKGLFLKKKTTFTFTKDGDPGINGTDIVCKIVPNPPKDKYKNSTGGYSVDPNYEYNCYPMVVNGNFNFGCLNYEKSENYNYYNNDQWFKVEIWKNGELIVGDLIKSTEEIPIKWGILKNIYKKNRQDESAIEITSEEVEEEEEDEDGTTKLVEKTVYHFKSLGYKTEAANIIKAEIEYDGLIYYAMLPVISVQLYSSLDNSYAIELKQNTGFRSVKYGDNGKNPLYSNSTPFTIRVLRNIDDKIEDISIINNEYSVNYSWNRRGRVFNNAKDVFDYAYDFTIQENENNLLEKNQRFLKPSDFYSGENVTNALEVTVSSGSSLVGKIHIPLYFFLDKFGHTELNAWDGNSISLSEDGGYILTPEIGAGQKHSDGTFTGLFMGKVREPNTDEFDIGLIGYYHKERTIFLDANTGKAEFGHLGKGQIIIDPSVPGGPNDPNALIYGGNFIRKDDDENEEGSGLLIDLTTPSIEFGSQKFMVYSNGVLKATDAILSGSMNATSGSFGSGQNKIKIGETSSKNSFIYSGEKTGINVNVPGFYLGTDGIALGNVAENEETGSAFKVTAGGQLTATKATVSGTINANGGSIGGWTINQNAISSQNGNIYLYADGAANLGTITIQKNGEVSASNMEIQNGNIVLAGDTGDTGNRNGLIVGKFDFKDDDTFKNARNCVGRDCIISRGDGTSESANFNYSKIRPGIINLSNSDASVKLDIDMTNAKSIKLTSSDDSSYIGIWKGGNSAYMKAAGVWAAAYNNGSLESKKKNIVADDGCLNQILNTDIVNFNWKFEDDGDKKHVGMVIPDEGGNYHYAEKALTHDRDAVDLYSAVMMAWKALQEMQAEIDEIKGE